MKCKGNDYDYLDMMQMSYFKLLDNDTLVFPLRFSKMEILLKFLKQGSINIYFVNRRKEALHTNCIYLNLISTDTPLDIYIPLEV